MHGMIRAAGAIGLITAALTGSVAGARADDGNYVVGHVYVDDNTAGANTVAGFDRHADGTLTPIAGSPFAVGGAGTGAGSARRTPSRSRTMAASCWRWMPAATRSRCCASATTDR